MLKAKIVFVTLLCSKVSYVKLLNLNHFHVYIRAFESHLVSEFLQNFPVQERKTINFAALNIIMKLLEDESVTTKYVITLKDN